MIFDKGTGYIIGGYRYEELVDAKAASAEYRMGDNFSFYGLDLGKESRKVKLERMVYDDRCQVYYIDTAAKEGSIGLSSNATWDPVPRTPTVIDPNGNTYKGIVREYLQSKGIANPVVKIDKVLRIDLEGDGQDEVIISGRNVETEDAETGQTIKKGSYSFMILRKIVGSKVATITIGSEIYTDDLDVVQWTPRDRDVKAILDLDADGIMEIVVYTTVYEGVGSTVYKIRNGEAVEVLSVGCGA